MAILAITEPTVDAALELLSAKSRYARFRPSEVPDTGLASDISLEALLAEVARRQRVLKQLSTVLTADTALARNPHIHPESIRVTALQWSLLIRVRHGITSPRSRLGPQPQRIRHHRRGVPAADLAVAVGGR